MDISCNPIEYYINLTDDEVNAILAKKSGFYGKRIDDMACVIRGKGHPIYDAFKNVWPSMTKITRHIGMILGYEAYLFYVIYTE